MPYALLLALLLAWPLRAEDLVLRMPAGMIETGFHKQILPRFKFKHRLTITPVTEGAADMAFGEAGTRVFSRIDGGETRLEILATDELRRDRRGCS